MADKDKAQVSQRPYKMFEWGKKSSFTVRLSDEIQNSLDQSAVSQCC